MLAHRLTKAEGAESYGYGSPDTKDEWREIAGMNLDDRSDYAGFSALQAPAMPI